MPGSLREVEGGEGDYGLLALSARQGLNIVVGLFFILGFFLFKGLGLFISDDVLWNLCVRLPGNFGVRVPVLLFGELLGPFPAKIRILDRALVFLHIHLLKKVVFLVEGLPFFPRDGLFV